MLRSCPGRWHSDIRDLANPGGGTSVPRDGYVDYAQHALDEPDFVSVRGRRMLADGGEANLISRIVAHAICELWTSMLPRTRIVSSDVGFGGGAQLGTHRIWRLQLAA